MLTIPYTTQEYILLPLTSWSGDVADPTTLSVSIAIITPGTDPTSGQYVAASWVTQSGVYKARVLWQTAVPNAAAHTVYDAWLKISSSPETPVMYAGPIRTY
jgi:hypothetical protein